MSLDSFVEILRRIYIVAIIFIVIVLGFSLFGLYQAVRPPKIVTPVTPEDFNLEYEEVTFATDDHLLLKGWFLPSRKPDAKTIVLLHGYPADKANVLVVGRIFVSEFNVFLFDFRYFGESEGKFTTVGALETKDVNAAIELMKARGHDEIGLWGLSMGGAVALMSAPDHPEVRAVVADSSYADLYSMANRLYIIPGFNYLLGHYSVRWAEMIFSLDADEVSPASSAGELNIPVLILHSKNDQVIPFEHALKIQAALAGNDKAEFWFRNRALHGQLSEQSVMRAMQFFKENL